MAGDFAPSKLGRIGHAVAESQDINPLDKKARIPVRFLPDAWIGIEEALLKKLESRHDARGARGRRQRAEEAIVAWGAGLAEERNEVERAESARSSCASLLDDALEKRTISIVEFSRAGLNPRYRGQRLTNSRRAADVLIHWALAYQASVREDAGDDSDGKGRPEEPVLV